ncbi:hypothetical protein [Streptococcus thermophilus]|uniref:hypothetical protein n=1 Tax=Streptococcus thermophilus TaxID=1308 RepID=UPI003A812388
MEIQYLEIDQICKPIENISNYIKDFSEAATVIDVQCNAIPVWFEKDGNDIRNGYRTRLTTPIH